MKRPVVLLGSQLHEPTVAEVVRSLAIHGPPAIVTAGWEEREPEDGELRTHLGGDAVALGLWPRAEEVFHADPEVRTLLYERYDRLRELQALYRLRLGPQLAAVRKLMARLDLAGPAVQDDLVGPEVEHALTGVRSLDAHHLERAAALDADVFARIDAAARPSIARHRAEIGELLAGAGAVLIAGGHVGILMNRLRLFGVLDLAPDLPIVAWSGGAMVLGERVVLFHDSPPQGPGNPEIYAPGMGLVRGALPLPDPRHRLRLDDRARVALFARRFAPDRCAALEGPGRLVGEAGSSDWTLAPGTLTLQADGGVVAEHAA